MYANKSKDLIWVPVRSFAAGFVFSTLGDDSQFLVATCRDCFSNQPPRDNAASRRETRMRDRIAVNQESGATEHRVRRIRRQPQHERTMRTRRVDALRRPDRSIVPAESARYWPRSAWLDCSCLLRIPNSSCRRARHRAKGRRWFVCKSTPRSYPPAFFRMPDPNAISITVKEIIAHIHVQ